MSLRDHQDKITPAPGWTRPMLARFFQVWQRWHLNDMKAGTEAQEAFMRKARQGKPYIDYTEACDMLTAAGLNPENGYSYGSKWLREAVPEDVLSFLQALPETDKTPAWV